MKPYMISRIALLVACLALVGCGGSNPPLKGDVQKQPPAEAKLAAPIVFSVAASTKEAAEELGAAFKSQSGTEVQVNPGPSSNLAKRILAGAPADLFLSANRQWADAVTDENLGLDSRPLLTNKLVLVVPKGNPAKVKTPEDLLLPDVKQVALAGETVPAGQYAQQALTKLDLYEKLQETKKVARGQDVRAALAYVERGEAEAGIVYSTDVAAAKVDVAHEFDPKLHDEIVYVLVLVKQRTENPAARNLYEFLASPDAAEVLRRHGFQTIEAQ